MSDKQSPTVNNADDKLAGFKIEVSHWRMRDYRQWMALGNRGRGWDEEANKIMSSIIKAWPFEGSPSNPTAYDDLKPRQWKLCIDAVEEATARLFQDD